MSESQLTAVKCAPASTSSTCEICFEEVKDCAEVPCGHKFCNGCMDCYISEVIQSDIGASREAICCPGVNCKILLEDEFVLKVLTDQQMKEKYYRIITCNFVMNNALIKYCPREKCSNAIKIPEGELSEMFSVCCSCCYWFCFQCQTDAHEPLSCEQAEFWRSLSVADTLSRDWIKNFTKKCPNCMANIEKNGGCMHMTCRHCKHEFCWICLAKWGNHRNCDANQATNAANGPTKFSRRFEHFNGHYQHMREALKKDEKLEAKLAFESEIEFKDRYLKTNFVRHGRETLHLCRLTLMYSYAFEYKWTSFDNRIFIFEQNLTSLENCTQKLYDILNSLSMENILEKQTEVFDGTEVCNKCRQLIINHIREGEAKGWWIEFPIPADYYQGDVEGLLQFDDA